MNEYITDSLDDIIDKINEYTRQIDDIDRRILGSQKRVVDVLSFIETLPKKMAGGR